MTTSGDEQADAFLGRGAATFALDGGFTHSFTAQMVGEVGGNRLARRERPYRPGAKLDSTGPKADSITLDTIWHRDIEEPGITGDDTRWPEALERFVADLKTGKTGTLNLPWRRGIRCKGDTWRRTAAAGENRGGETMQVTFEEDNEDSLDRKAMQVVSVKATVRSQVEAAQFDAESEGMDVFAIEDITQLAADVVGLLNTPQDTAAALAHAGNRLRRAVETVLTAYSSGEPGRDQLNGPEGARTKQRLLELAELGARAVGESRPRPTRTVTYPRAMTIWTVATDQLQGARDLMVLNEQIEDFAYIPAKSPIRVYAD